MRTFGLGPGATPVEPPALFQDFGKGSVRTVPALITRVQPEQLKPTGLVTFGTARVLPELPLPLRPTGRVLLLVT